MYNSETTHYDVLGVPHTANQSEIRSAYKAAVLTYHPDRQGGNMSNDKLQSQRGLTFEMIQSAWEVRFFFRSAFVSDCMCVRSAGITIPTHSSQKIL
uniref:J domain-containing protein n=1 Tax=Tetraselmis sp. GSL018 TaxID=582737 RepID=A0A061RPL4_9CHLO|mmetsp:Transcript_26861/g.63765  ORF Transcript_26861/g.63765 Transcript_26861/m.63765 type:complete len:97 (+) Transcript_26861:120-410(+)